MSRDCYVLASELIDAARDEDREPGATFSSDVMTALWSIAERLQHKGVPPLTTATIMRDCARSIEADVWWETPPAKDRQLTVDAAREALVQQGRRLAELVKKRSGDQRLSEAQQTVESELEFLKQGGPNDRAEAVVRLARVLCDTYELGLEPTTERPPL